MHHVRTQLLENSGTPRFRTPSQCYFLAHDFIIFLGENRKIQTKYRFLKYSVSTFTCLKKGFLGD